MEEIRLQKYLAECGIASRKKCEIYITLGTKLGTKVKPLIDEVFFEDKKVMLPQQKYTYILLNKPIGVVTTVKDPFQRPCVLDLVKVKQRVLPVGRLDMYTSGALILTDDGDFIYRVTHPKHEINKTYIVTIVGIIEEKEIQQLQQGVRIEGGYQTKPAKVSIIKIDKEKNITRMEIVIHEGKNRQVRKMCEAIGKKVVALHRAKIGTIGVKNLPIGSWRYLNTYEVEAILKS